MKLLIYKGFDIAFLEQLDGTPLVDGDIAAKINVLSFQKKTRKVLERELLDLEDFAIAVTGVKGVGVYIFFQPLCNIIHVGTSWLAGVSLEAR